MGLAFGLVGGLLVYLINSHSYDQYFEDFYYWMGSDGIRLFKHNPDEPVSRPVIVVPDEPEPEPLVDDYDEEEDEVEVEMSVPSEDDYEMGPAYL